MCNLLTSFMQGILYEFQHLRHGILAVEHTSGLFISLDEEFEVALEIFVEFLHLHDGEHYAIDLSVKAVVLKLQGGSLFYEGLAGEEAAVEFALGISEGFLLAFQFVDEISVPIDPVIQISLNLFQI